MTFLMVLLVMIGGFVVMAWSVLGLSYALGRHLHASKCPKAKPSAAEPCAQCDADRDWYLGLPMWEQNLMTGWWLVNRIVWNTKGCK